MGSIPVRVTKPVRSIPALPGRLYGSPVPKCRAFNLLSPPASRNPSHSVLLTAVRTISFCCPVRINICTGRLHGPLVKWSRRRPLTPQTGVRLSHGSPHADVVELADAADSKSVGSNTMRVQVPPSAPMRCITENGRTSGTTI